MISTLYFSEIQVLELLTLQNSREIAREKREEEQAWKDRKLQAAGRPDAPSYAGGRASAATLRRRTGDDHDDDGN